MPVIEIKLIKGAVLQSDAQKRELLKRMTDTFIDVVGEVARPFTYCIIEEQPMYEWALGGHPIPDYEYLSGPEFMGLHEKSNQIMQDYVAQMKARGMEVPRPPTDGSSSGGSSTESARAASADAQWRGSGG